MGDPRGVGPEVVVKALHDSSLPEVRVLVVGAAAVLRAAAASLGLSARGPLLADEAWDGRRNAVLDLAGFPASALEPRGPDAASGRASMEYVERAAQLVLSGRADALVTAPISKEAIGAAGSPFPGHTEMLADLSGGARPVMLMVNPHLRVALVTAHMALRDVPAALRPEAVVDVARILADGLRRCFGISAPRLALCGLNPHCGDGGRFGDEETRILAPAIRQARAGGISIDGPLPADTVFTQAQHGAFDAVIACYHDQGLVAVKLGGLAHVVDVTLGLPFIRTGVGHGTAYDIAGTGRADHQSTLTAIRLAAEMVRTSRRAQTA
jgi:4-hydroxythreonine-4-phosphate dehydrogenase